MEIKPQIRYLKEMEDVVYDKDFAENNPDLELYYVNREVKKRGDLRYDITIIPPQMLGKEFVRTKGNRNSEGYQELYTVLEGKAFFLMQKSKKVEEVEMVEKSRKGKEREKIEIEDVVVTKAKSGDWVIIPPDYVIITINPSKQRLKTGNWVSENTKNIYKDVEKMQGACYYYTNQGWLKNKNYKKVPELEFKEPLKERPKNLDFLNVSRET